MYPELIFILVAPAREENIGAAARAMKTMNIPCLRLVNPLCNPLGERARATAHASVDILESAEVFASLEEARSDISLLIGSAAKRRTVGEDVHPVARLTGIIRDKGETVRKVGIVFGGEESGLSNVQLMQCDMLSTIPMHRKYPSLNLGQAVMVYATYLSDLTLTFSTKHKPPVAPDELPVVREKALQVLADVGLDADDIIHRRIVERLMLLGKDDLNLFHSFCKYYLKKYHGRIK
ncbi:MAG: TrmH family RNA methyltransferase [Bacteroidales bacterium]